MLHYILVFLTYILFIAAACDDKYRVKADFKLSVPIITCALHVFLLTFLYEKLLVSILLNKIHSHDGYILFSAIGSGVYTILFFAGLVVIGYLMACPLPNRVTIIVFIISLILNIYLITKATGYYYEEMLKNMGNGIFDNFYSSLSTTKRPAVSDTLLNLKWIVMIIPGVAYLIQLITNKSED